MSNRWPDVLESPEAQIMRDRGEIDFTAMCDLFDKSVKSASTARHSAPIRRARIPPGTGD